MVNGKDVLFGSGRVGIVLDEMVMSILSPAVAAVRGLTSLILF